MREIGLDDLRLLRAWKCVTGVEDGGSATCVGLSDELPRLELRWGCRIDVCVAVAGHCRRQVVVGRLLGHRLEGVA